MVMILYKRIVCAKESRDFLAFVNKDRVFIMAVPVARCRCREENL